MDSINSTKNLRSVIAGATSIRPESEVSAGEKAQKTSDAKNQREPELSTLAKQLSAAAERAAARDSQLSRRELAELASLIRDRIGGQVYTLAKEFYDAQRPDTEDPELLERARQATEFVNGKGVNPFKGLSREQLSLITYDESGAFTVNERRAASSEADSQHNEWAKYIMSKMDAERQQTGRNDQALYEIIDYYNSLPPIEVAGYGNYEAIIRSQIGLQEVEWPEFNTSLIDMIANEWKPTERLPDPQLPDLSSSVDGEGRTR